MGQDKIKPQDNSEKVVTLILGQRGTGKSYFAKDYIKNMDRLVIYDPQGEYTDGFIFEDIEDLKKFWAEHTEKFRLIFNPLNHYDFSHLCDLVYNCGEMTFLVEELDLVAGTYDTNIEFQTIIKRGRHRDIAFIGVSQRPFGINRNISSQAKEFFIFNQREPRDIQYLKDYLGACSEVIQELTDYNFLYVNYLTNEIKIRRLKNGSVVDIKTLQEEKPPKQKLTNRE